MVFLVCDRLRALLKCDDPGFRAFRVCSLGCSIEVRAAHSHST